MGISYDLHDSDHAYFVSKTTFTKDIDKGDLIFTFAVDLGYIINYGDEKSDS